MGEDLSTSNMGVAHWADHKWRDEWKSNTSRLHDFVPVVELPPSGISLLRPAWVKLNRLRTGVGLFRSTMHKWGMAPSAACECGAEEQTADHIITSCPLYLSPNGPRGISAVDDDTVAWLCNKCPNI